MQTTEVDVAYLSGLFDGEGSVSIGKFKEGFCCGKYCYERYALRISVTNTCEAVAIWVKEHFGGYVFSRQSKKHWTVRHDWYCGGNLAAEILRTIEPYLIIKKEQARLGQTFQRTFAHTGAPFRTPDSIQENRKQIWAEIIKLNSRKGQASKHRLKQALKL